MSETDLYTEILSGHSRGPTRLLRINAGMAYQGRVIDRTPGRLILAPWYPIRLAAEGVSDLIGFTQEDDRAIFVAIEGKVGRRKATPEQEAFLEMVRRHGGRAGVARSSEQAGIIIRGEI